MRSGRFVSFGAMRRAPMPFVMMFIVTKRSAAADLEMDRAANCLEHVFCGLSWALRTNAFAGLHIDPSLLVSIPCQVLTCLWNEHMTTTTGRLNVRPLLLEAVFEKGAWQCTRPTDGLQGLHIDPSLLVFIPCQVLTCLRNEYVTTTTGRLNIRPLLLEATKGAAAGRIHRCLLGHRLLRVAKREQREQSQ